MTRTIIIPLSDPATDPEGIAERAVAHARLLPAFTDADTILVSAVDVGDDVSRRQAYLDLIAGTVGGPVRTVVEYGDPATVILDTVATVDDPLIVMASHGRKGVALRMLGSVTYAIAHRAHCPVLILPTVPLADARIPANIQRVLVAISEPDVAEGLLDATLNALGEDITSVSLHLVEVAEPIPPLPNVVAGETYEDARDVPAHILRRVAARATERGAQATWGMRIGDTAQEIVRAAREEGSDLIVLATCGRERCGRVVPGTIAAEVSTNLAVPVLLVRPLDPSVGSAGRHKAAHAL
jgi:nucleotide-binding universal stress UspA family protein